MATESVSNSRGVINSFLEPPVNSVQVRTLLTSAAIEERTNYPSACNLVVDAWLISIADSISYGTRILAHAAIDILACNLANLVNRSKANTLEMAHSLKLNIALPCVLFMSIFFPQVFERLHYNAVLIARENQLQQSTEVASTPSENAESSDIPNTGQTQSSQEAQNADVQNQLAEAQELYGTQVDANRQLNEENQRLNGDIFNLTTRIGELEEQIRQGNESRANLIADQNQEFNLGRIQDLTSDTERLQNEKREITNNLARANEKIANLEIKEIYSKRLQQFACLATTQNLRVNIVSILNPQADSEAEWGRVKIAFSADQGAVISLIEQTFPVPSQE